MEAGDYGNKTFDVPYPIDRSKEGSKRLCAKRIAPFHIHAGTIEVTNELFRASRRYASFIGRLFQDRVQFFLGLAPKVVKEGVKKEEAEEFKQKLEGVGATVELQ